MIEKEFRIRNRLGLHARPAAQFVKITGRSKSKVRVIRDDIEIDGKSIMGLLMLAAECGSKIKVVIEGEDELATVQELEKLIENGFYEEIPIS